MNTGPMCVVDVVRDGTKARLKARVRSNQKAASAEIIVNGSIHETIAIDDATDALIERDIPLDGTTWIAVRVWEPRADERIRFAHSSPVWFDDPQKPLRSRPEQAAFLIQRVQDEITRSRDKLSPNTRPRLPHGGARSAGHDPPLMPDTGKKAIFREKIGQRS